MRAVPSDATVSCLAPSTGEGEGAAIPSRPVLPHEPEAPTSLQDAERWLEIYDEYLQNLRTLGRESGVEDELRPWIARCDLRRLYWARARDRLQRLEQRGTLER